MRRFTHRLCLPVAAALTTFLTSCGPPPPEPVAPGELGTMASELIRNSAPDSTASTYETLEGFAGAVALIGHDPELATCVGTLVQRNMLLTSLACALTVQNTWNDGSTRQRAWFPQAWGTTLYSYNILLDIWSHNGIAILKLDRDVPEVVVGRTAPVMTGRVNLNPGNSINLYSVAFSPGQDADTSRFWSHLGVLHSTEPSEPYRMRIVSVFDSWETVSGLEGSPLVRLDPETGNYSVLGVFDSARKLPSGSGPILIVTNWNNVGGGNIPEEWRNGPPLIAQIGPDRNLDGFPDGIDCGQIKCPEKCGLEGAVDDPLAHYFNENSNSHVEWYFRYIAADLDIETMIDACEGVPLLRLEKLPSRIGDRRQETSGDAPSSSVLFQGIPRMGVVSVPRDFSENVAFRYCSCLNGALEHVDESSCWAQCPAGGASSWGFSTSAWAPIEPLLTSGSSRFPVDGKKGGAAQLFRRGILGNAPSEFVWNWYGPADSGKIRARPSGDGRGLETSGYIASFVVPDGPQRSIRDDNYQQELRVSLQHFSLPDYIDSSTVFTLAPPHPFDGPMRDPRWPHENFHDKFLLRKHPPLGPGPWMRMLAGADFLTHPALAISPDPGRFVTLRDAGQALDVTSHMSPGVKQLLGSAGWEYLSPTEPQRLLDGEGKAARAVAVPEHGAPHSGLFLIESGLAGLRLRGEVWSGPGEGLAGLGQVAGASLPHSLLFDFTMGQGAAAVLSGWEEAIYVVGGIGSMGQVRRYDLVTGGSSSFVPQMPASDVVMSVTYDLLSRTLYALEVVTKAGGDVIRLVSIPLSSDDPQSVLWEGTYDGSQPFVSLDLNLDRDLVLTAGNTTHFTAWQVERETGAFKGRLDGIGTMLTAPRMGHDELTLPVLDAAGAVSYRTYHRWEFVEGEACEAL